MAYLVTGGTGYIGSYTVRDLLDAGKDVVCLQRSGITPVFRHTVGEDRVGKVKIVQGDVSDTLLLFNLVKDYNIEKIVHTAYVMQPVSELQPAYALRANCFGMNNILEAVRLFGLKKLVWLSSSLAFGHIYKFYKKPMGDDDAFFLPHMFYGATKVLDEFQARLYFDKFKVDSIGLRISITYGVGKNGRARTIGPLWLRDAALDKPVIKTDPDMSYGYLYVEDLSKLIVKACEAPTTKTRVFNVREGQYSNRKMVEIIRKINPQAQVTLGAPSPAGRTIQSPETDTTGIRKELGWEPEYSLEEGLRKTFNIWREQEGLPLL